MQYQLVPMDKSHLAQVVEIEQACFTHPWSENLMAEQLYNETISLIAAQREDGTVLGYGQVQVILDEGCLDKIAVHPDCRRQGVAEAILSAFLRFGAAHLAFLTLEVRETNAAAIALYEKLGFREVGRRPKYYAELGEDAVIMTKEFDGHDTAGDDPAGAGPVV